MSAVAEFLKETPTVYVATIGLDGRPKNRPFQFAMEKDGKLWFCTSNTKQVYEQLKKFPAVEICTMNARFEWIRIQADVVFSDDMLIKEAILDAIPGIRKIYGSGGNPVFEAFYLKNGRAIIEGFSGNPPQEYAII